MKIFINCRSKAILGPPKKIFGSGSSKAMQNIKLSLTYSEFTVHMQNQLKAGSFVGTKVVLSHDMQFFSDARAME